MKLSDLIKRFRTDANDKAEPHFWTSEEVTAWFNDAENEAALRGRLIHECQDAGVCEIVVTAGQSVYPLHHALYEITHLRFDIPGETCRLPLKLRSPEALDDTLRDWRTAEPGIPQYAVQDDLTLRLVPTPDRAGALVLEGYRLPLTPMVVEAEDEPEIHHAHHVHLVQWVLHRAFSVPDSEAFDAARAAKAEAEFTRYFGIRPDSDLRRITREDAPHHVEAAWP